jgi:hypothetical protein
MAAAPPKPPLPERYAALGRRSITDRRPFPFTGGATGGADGGVEITFAAAHEARRSRIDTPPAPDGVGLRSAVDMDASWCHRQTKLGTPNQGLVTM